MATPFDAKVKALLDGKNFGTVATINPDGSPQTSVVWVDRDDDAVVFSATGDKRKTRNLQRDPRINVSIYDVTNPYFSVSLTGTAELVPDPDAALLGRLSHKYFGTDPQPDPDGTQRFVVRLVPERITVFGA
jgi:PPOX class probable F420-dependent enzyme